MGIPFSEQLNPERRQAELNTQRKIKLFYRFAGPADRDKALKLIAESREFRDELSHVDLFADDTDPGHSADGLVLGLDKYDPAALSKIESYLNNNGCPVADRNEWIVEPAEQEKQAEAGRYVAPAAPSNIIEMKPKPEPETWEEKEAA